jgi:ABC-type multidrug transport system ATPase subunit
LPSVLSLSNISKSYGSIQALKNVSFDVPKGSVFGVLGPNGSGKTTLLGIILDVLHADAGSYAWFDNEPKDAARRKVGSLLETPNFYHYLSASDNLDISAAIKRRGQDDKDRVLAKVGLLERKNSPFHTYSLGMKQRLAIGAALLGNPDVLVLDEPTNGLDPAGIAEIRDLIRQLSEEGITIIMASHLLDEVEKVCTHVAILKKGDLLLHGSVNESLHSEDVVEVAAHNSDGLLQLLTAMPGIKKAAKVNGMVQLVVEDNITPEQVNQYCIQNGITLSHLLLKKKSLETKFMELTNH